MKKISSLYENLPLNWYLAFRRLLPKTGSPGIVLLPRIAFIAIVVGVSASILILSLANGLHHNYLRRLAESGSHISTVTIGKGIPDYQNIINEIKQIKSVQYVYPFSQREALLQSYDETTGIVVKAYPPDFNQHPIFREHFRLMEGEWSFNSSRGITIGEALAKSMSLFVGDFVNILVYDNSFGAIPYRFKIIGIFTASDAGIDQGLAFVSFDDAAEIFDFRDFTPSIGVHINDFEHPEQLTKALNDKFPVRFSHWKAKNLHSLIALQNEKKIIQVLLIIFFIVNFFGILSVMTALVADKREEIALLKALGMKNKDNSNSLLLTGLLLGVVASCLGLIIGVLLSWQFNNLMRLIEGSINAINKVGSQIFSYQFYAFSFLNQNVYYLKEFPILIQWQDLLFASLSAIVCTVLASYYPAHLSKKYHSAEILRKRAF